MCVHTTDGPQSTGRMSHRRTAGPRTIRHHGHVDAAGHPTDSFARRDDRARRARRLPHPPRVPPRCRAGRNRPRRRHRRGLRTGRDARLELRHVEASPGDHAARGDRRTDRRPDRDAGDDDGPLADAGAIRARRGDPGGLERARRQGPQRRPPLPRQPDPGARRYLPRGRVQPAGRHPRRRGRLSGAFAAARLRPGLAGPPQRSRHPAHAHPRRRRQGLRADGRRDGVADRREDGAGPGPRLQRPVAGPHDPRHGGRHGPGHLQEQPQGDHRDPLPRGRLRQLLHGRRAVRDPEAVRSRRVVHLRVRGEAGRLDDVPLAPQRDRPGRPRAPRRVHHRSQGRCRPGEGVREEVRLRLRSRVHLGLERHARRLHDQRPRLPGRDPGRRGGRRDGPGPLHERRDHDAPVAQPRVHPEDRRPRRAPPRRRIVRLRHASPSTRASGSTRSSSATAPACGPTTATSSPTSRGSTGCSAW